MNHRAVWAFIAAGALAASNSAARAQTMSERVKPYLEQTLIAGYGIVSVSAASGMPAEAPGSMGSIFGANLAAQVQVASLPYPTSLGGVSLQIVDAVGTSRLAQLLYVSPGQINYIVPAAIATGTATINFTDGAGNARSGTVEVLTVAPGLFTANADGTGVVAATAYRTFVPSTLALPVNVFTCGSAPGSCTAVPIDPGVDAPVTVVLYATGLKGRSSDSAVTLSIGTQSVPVRLVQSFTDGPLEGIDQVVFGLPLSLRGAGEVDVILSAGGVASNAGRIHIQ